MLILIESKERRSKKTNTNNEQEIPASFLLNALNKMKLMQSKENKRKKMSKVKLIWPKSMQQILENILVKFKFSIVMG